MVLHFKYCVVSLTHTLIWSLKIFDTSETCDSSCHVDTMNETVEAVSRCGPHHEPASGVVQVSLVCRTLVFQYSLPHQLRTQFTPGGRPRGIHEHSSMSMSPWRDVLNMMAEDHLFYLSVSVHPQNMTKSLKIPDSYPFNKVEGFPIGHLFSDISSCYSTDHTHICAV